MSYDRAVEQSVVLLDAARQAGVSRLVHVSVVNASIGGPTPYVRAKGQLERNVLACGIPATIVRPTLTYGPSDILVNNLAWALRRLPIYGIPGDGRYPIQPVHVDDVARICLEAAHAEPGSIVDARGAETLTYREMVEIVKSACGSRARAQSMPRTVVLVAARLLGLLLRDVVLTSDEILELSSGFLSSPVGAAGSDLLRHLGRSQCELARAPLVERAESQLPWSRRRDALTPRADAPSGLFGRPPLTRRMGIRDETRYGWTPGPPHGRMIHARIRPAGRC